jgi:RHH-type proline utilization regulon transcriptional repressor/proline dehydrogenase/delta 1-pyrroline-5-carboxylate dehydrogenase
MSHEALSAALMGAEEAALKPLLKQAAMSPDAQARVQAIARQLVGHIRAHRRPAGGIDAFLREYDLSSEEGLVLMCLAEALLRIPDHDTADRLIRDKIAPADWARHLGHSDSWFVNASTLGLMLTGRIERLGQDPVSDVSGFMKRLVARTGEPVIRQALTHAMRIMGKQFVLGRTIDEAVTAAGAAAAHGFRHSFDMLGEGARTAADAARYFAAYANAIEAVGAPGSGLVAPGVSVKLSALHPRFEFAQHERIMAELVPRLLDLAALAQERGLLLTVDAEEAARLGLGLDVFEAVYRTLGRGQGFGLAVQAYQKRAGAVLDRLADLAASGGRPIPVRLVKGAYWDSEIKWAQERGFAGYPVFTRKAATDVSYLACARQLISAKGHFLPQFATHNAHTVAAILVMTGADHSAAQPDFEFQRLHGMGEPLYDLLSELTPAQIPCRIYAPVGSHEDLLAYLVRRLLENGANSSFVNRLSDDAAPIEEIVRDPVEAVHSYKSLPHPQIPLPADLFGAERRNSEGLALFDPLVIDPLLAGIKQYLGKEPLAAGPVISGALVGHNSRAIRDPADHGRTVGTLADAAPGQVGMAIAAAEKAAGEWDAIGGAARAAILRNASYLFEAHRPALMALCIRETGKTIPDALDELREAVDFLRYYAARAEEEFSGPVPLPGPTGEQNSMTLNGRGIFACISPWNFPLAIFTGQIAAALAAGNAVIAKPAEQASLVAYRATQLLHEAGVPPDILHLLPGDGAQLGAAIVTDPRIAGVAFTGSTETARAIARGLAAREGPIVPFIAETGGLNALIADSSALPEQLVDDIVRSAFNSAGQRCSALRILFLQEDGAARVLDMLAGAMAELRIGDPMEIATDIGPVIDEAAREMLRAHQTYLNGIGRQLAQTPMPDGIDGGCFFAPCAYEIDSHAQLRGEKFGPILHIVRYQAGHLDKVCAAINSLGFGLTAGVHSRIDATIAEVAARLKVGNLYVNRNIVGAVVGVQPFGGEGLSGTGPKAGGPRYLHRFATERAVSWNVTAAGGNAGLLSLDAERPL